MKISHLIAFSLFTVFCGSTNAALIAEYNFDDGSLINSATSGSFTPLDVVGTPPILNGNSYHSDGNSNNYLEIAPAVGGSPTYTVSVWVRTETPNQGNFKGIFSNNDSAGAANSWQIDNHSGQYRLNSVNTGVDVFGNTANDEWQNLILQKDGSGSIFLDGVLIGAVGGNPGGLQEFRIGINRNTDNSFTGLIDNIQIFDTIEDPAAIFAAGPGRNAADVPEPTTAALGLMGIAGLVMRRRRAA